MAKTRISTTYDFVNGTFTREDGISFDVAKMKDADEESKANPESTNLEVFMELPLQYKREFVRGVSEDVCNNAAGKDNPVFHMQEMLERIYRGENFGKREMSKEEKALKMVERAELKLKKQKLFSEIEILHLKTERTVEEESELLALYHRLFLLSS